MHVPLVGVLFVAHHLWVIGLAVLTGPRHGTANHLGRHASWLVGVLLLLWRAGWLVGRSGHRAPWVVWRRALSRLTLVSAVVLVVLARSVVVLSVVVRPVLGRVQTLLNH